MNYNEINAKSLYFKLLPFYNLNFQIKLGKLNFKGFLTTIISKLYSRLQKKKGNQRIIGPLKLDLMYKQQLHKNENRQ